jgi:hypothetical protein
MIQKDQVEDGNMKVRALVWGIDEVIWVTVQKLRGQEWEEIYIQVEKSLKQSRPVSINVIFELLL